MSDSKSIFAEIPDFHYQSGFMRPVSREAFDNIVHNRRSVRVYSDEKVPAEVVEQVLEWGLLAPNSSNLQAWEFYWVKDPIKKEKLVEALFSQPAARTAAELIVAVARTNTWKRTRKQMLGYLQEDAEFPKRGIDYYKTLVPLVYTQGPLGIIGLIKKIVFAVVGIFRVTPREPSSMADMRVWAVKSTALACENIMLGFSAFGFYSCPMEGHDSRRVKKILSLGRGSEIVMVISAGKRNPERGVYGPRIRMKKENFIKII